MKQTKTDEWISAFIIECNTMSEVFKAQTDKEMFELLTKNKQLTKQKMRTFMSLILQIEEEKILKICYGMCIEKELFLPGENKCVLCHDGVMIEKDCLQDINEFIEELNECVFEEMGYKCGFKHKEMDEGYKIQEILDKNNIVVQDKYIDEWVEMYGIERNSTVNDDDDTLADLFFTTKKTKYVMCSSILYAKDNFGIYKTSSKNALKKDYSQHTKIFDNEYKNTPYKELTNFAITLLRKDASRLEISQFLKSIKKTEKYMKLHSDTIKKKMRNTTGQNNIAGSLEKKYTDERFIDKLDINPNLIGFSNGVLDLRESFDKVRNTKEGEYVSMTTGYDFIINDKIQAKALEIFHIIDSMFHNQEVTEFVLKSIAKCLKGGNNVEEWSLFFKGGGSNGKGLLNDFLMSALGNYHCSLDYKVFTHIKNDNRSVELHSVAKKRYCCVSEPPKVFELNADVFKKWTGNDEITVRNNYATSMTVFKAPTTGFQANHQLQFDGDTEGHSMKRRIVAIPFPNTFVDNPRLPNEKQKNDKLKKECELDSFKMPMMFLLLKYYQKYLKEGLSEIPEIIKTYTEKYVSNLSSAKEWFETNLKKDDDKGYNIKVKDLFDRYRNDTKEYNWKLKEFKEKLTSFGYILKTGKAKSLDGRYDLPGNNNSIVHNIIFLPLFDDCE